MSDMGTQLITLNDTPRAICTTRRVFVFDHAAPDTRFVLAMCLYAGAILNGQIPGPYRDTRARAYARALLIPAELLEAPRTTHDPAPVAAWLGIPVDELQTALRARSRTPRRQRTGCWASRRSRRTRNRRA